MVALQLTLSVKIVAVAGEVQIRWKKKDRGGDHAPYFNQVAIFFTHCWHQLI